MQNSNKKIESHTSHRTLHTSQKGITLIALIITIIVMLILVGVTINVALNGGIFEKAEIAAMQTEKQAIYEQIVAAMQLTREGKIDIQQTYDVAKRELEAQGRTVSQITNGTFTVKGKHGEYTYTITENEIIIGPGKNTPVANDFKIEVVQKNVTNGDITTGVSLIVIPTIPDSWHPDFSKSTIAATYINNEVIFYDDEEEITLKELNLKMHNYIYSEQQLNSYTELENLMKDQIAGQDPENEIFAILLPLTGASIEIEYTSVQECAEDFYYYYPKSVKLRVGKDDDSLTNVENVFWGSLYEYSNCAATNSSVIEGNGKYIIELEIDGKIARETIEVTSIYEEPEIPEIPEVLTEGSEFEMDADKNGTPETWIVLYDGSASHLNENEIEVISKNTMGNLALGASNNITEAIDSYNNAIGTLNSYCESLIKIENLGVRSVGSKPSDPTYRNTSKPYAIQNLDKWGNKTAWNTYGVLGEDGDTNSDDDEAQMQTLGIKQSGNDYWLASRYVDEYWDDSTSHGGVYFYVRCVHSYGGYDNYLWYVYSYGGANTGNPAYAVRPVVKLQNPESSN